MLVHHLTTELSPDIDDVTFSIATDLTLYVYNDIDKTWHLYSLYLTERNPIGVQWWIHREPLPLFTPFKNGQRNNSYNSGS